MQNTNLISPVQLENCNAESKNLSKECRFCQIAHGVYKHDKIDRPILENEKFMAFASIGALVPGWTLITPRFHDFSMKNYYGNQDFNSFVNQSISTVKKLYPDLIAFEHGANKKGSLTACGTEHAHLHLVPFTGSLLQDMFDSGLSWKKCKASEISSISDGQEYLFYSELKNDWEECEGYIHILRKPISQFFRKIIATRLGKPKEYDYKINPNFKNSILTYTSLTSIVS